MSNYNFPGVRKKTEVINTEFDDRHRYNFGPLPALDLDIIEYKNDKPAILFETKHGKIVTIDLADKQMTRLRNTANLLNIPFFVVVYYFPGLNKVTNELDTFGKSHKYYVIAANELARSYLTYSWDKLMTEKQFVELIYRIKNQPIPTDLILDNTIDTKLDLPLILNLKGLMNETQ